MAISKGVCMGSIVVGCLLLVFTLISVICGGVAMSKMGTPVAVSIGLWGFYFAIPGGLSIVAGYKKLSSLLAVALATHILGTIIAIVGMSLAAAFWAILASNCIHTFSILDRSHCTCLYENKLLTYAASCSDLKTVRECTGAVTIIFALYAIITFVGSIYGCIGTCCAPREPTVIVTTALQPNTIVMTTGTAQTVFNQQPPPPYGQPVGQVQGQMVIDSKP